MTPAERKLWWHVRELAPEGSHFRRQATIGPYFADFACHTTKVVIEIDGGQHGNTAQVKRDLKRDAYLKRTGYRVLRFWNSDVRENIKGVMTLICGALDSAQMPPTPNPSPPQAGGGELQLRDQTIPQPLPAAAGGGELQLRDQTIPQPLPTASGGREEVARFSAPPRKGEGRGK